MANIKFVTCDGENFEVEGEVASYMLVIDELLDVLNVDESDDEPIPLIEVDSQTFVIILDWIARYRNDPPALEIDVNDYSTNFNTTWEDEFFKDVNLATLNKLILASNYLNITNLYISTQKLMARLINGKTVAQVRETFGIENDFSEDEVEEDEVSISKEFSDEEIKRIAAEKENVNSSESENGEVDKLAETEDEDEDGFGHADEYDSSHEFDFNEWETESTENIDIDNDDVILDADNANHDDEEPDDNGAVLQ